MAFTHIKNEEGIKNRYSSERRCRQGVFSWSKNWNGHLRSLPRIPIVRVRTRTRYISLSSIELRLLS